MMHDFAIAGSCDNCWWWWWWWWLCRRYRRRWQQRTWLCNSVR